MLEKERRIYREQALEDGKPEKVVERIVEGKLEKFYAEAVLLEQPFVKDPDLTIEKLIAEHDRQAGREHPGAPLRALPARRRRQRRRRVR